MSKTFISCLAILAVAMVASACEPEDTTNRVTFELADVGAPAAADAPRSASAPAPDAGRGTEAASAMPAAPAAPQSESGTATAAGVGDAAMLLMSAPVITVAEGAIVSADGITASLGGMMMGGMMMGGEMHEGDMAGMEGMMHHTDTMMSGMEGMSGMMHQTDTMMAGMEGMSGMMHQTDTMMAGMEGMSGMMHHTDTMMSGMEGMSGMGMGMGMGMGDAGGNFGTAGMNAMHSAMTGAAPAPTITVDAAFLAVDLPDLAKTGDARRVTGALAREWMELARRRVQADKMSPPAAARAFGYLGIAMYESVVHGAADQRSLAGQLAGLDRLPLPGPGEYHWPTVLAAAVEGVGKSLFPSATSHAMLASALKKQVEEALGAGVSPAVIERSLNYGRALAVSILAWSSTDHYADTRLKTYSVPKGDGLWVPTGAVTIPLEPFWGELRLMSAEVLDACALPEPNPFSADKTSAFFADAKKVYDAGKNLSEQDRATAQYWADLAGKSSTPAGHWESIVGQVVTRDRLSLARAAELYALVGLSMSDAFISCWASKYEHNVVRPQSYIQKYIDPAWKPYIDTPPFPEYPSGHSTGSAAAAAVLTALAAPGAITDTANDGTPLGTRTYATFQDAAKEAMMSRLYGGIHYPASNELGFKQGECIGKQVIATFKTRK